MTATLTLPIGEQLHDVPITVPSGEVEFAIAELFPIQPATPTARLLQADTTQPSVLPTECVDLIVTSPPYNVGKSYNGDPNGDLLDYEDYVKFTRRWLKNCYDWARTTGRLCVNVAVDKSNGGRHPLAADVTHAAIDVGWKYHTTIQWNEGNISKRTAWGS